MPGEGERAPVIPCDTSRPELYSQASWEPLFRQMRQSAPLNRVEGTANGDYWNVCSHALITEVEGKPDLFSSRSEEHTSELQSLMRISYAVFCLKKKNKQNI